MRVVDSGPLADEVAGSSVGDVLEVTVRRGSAFRDLEVAAWSISWDVSRQVQGQASFTVADPDGSLAAWGVGDLLAPGGSVLTVTWVSGLSGTRVPLGWWLIRSVEPRESWVIQTRTRPDGTRELVPGRLPGGGQVVVRADEYGTAKVKACRLDMEPVVGSRWTEVRRLTWGVGVALSGLLPTDLPSPGSLVYEDDRMDAIEDHLTSLGARYRGGPDGSIEVVPSGPLPSVWTIDGGPDGALVSVDRALSDDGIYNIVRSAAEVEVSGQRRQIVGRAWISSGPLDVDGPFGRRPLFHQSPATTQTGVDSDAKTLLDNRQRTAAVVLPVDCLFHPGIQLLDTVTVVAATTAGDAALTGEVVSMTADSIQDAGSTPAKRMRLGVSVPVEALEAVAHRLGSVRG